VDRRRNKLIAELVERLRALRGAPAGGAPARDASDGDAAATPLERAAAAPSGAAEAAAGPGADWRELVAFMERADRSLLLRVNRRLINHLCALGIEPAQHLLARVDAVSLEAFLGETNEPAPKHALDLEVLLSDEPFALAAGHLGDDAVLSLVQRWIQEDQAGELVATVNDPRSSLQEIGHGLRRYHHLLDCETMSRALQSSLRVQMCQRFLTDSIDFVKVAKDVVRLEDFVAVLDRLVMPPDSHGRLGGKGAGLLLAAWLLSRAAGDGGRAGAALLGGDTAITPEDSPFGAVYLPRTWFVASDAVLDFLRRNDLEDVMDQKFKTPERVRSQYPNIVQLFKNSLFPPEIIQGLAGVLADLGERPLIIRSSSLLEDRLGTAFSGKYKSLFLPNRGTPERRLEALLDAVTEIYASVFGPDPIAYRRDHGLLEFDEQMGLLIQEVVGRAVGPYYLPVYAGVAFSVNELRWSPRIRRDDGLVRLVPGLGTRAVDRVGDDYPILFSPGQPRLRASVQPGEIARYSPRAVDVIDRERGRFVTIPLRDLVRAAGRDLPELAAICSVVRDERLLPVAPLLVDPDRDELVVTFEGLLERTPFAQRIKAILDTLAEGLRSPVDIEFAHDGERFYLLQCRPQSRGGELAPTPIPGDLARDRVLFTAHRYVTSGRVPELSYLVYVDPDAYAALPDTVAMRRIGRAIGRLNGLLPRRGFALLGPGRWGSRGDVKLGVPVTYADISAAALLVEIARRKGSYVPDLSFGTHFFQDLVEARIRYLPLYPDEGGNVFRDEFFRDAPNQLAAIAPELAPVAATVKVIDVPATSGGLICRVALDGERDEAMAYLAEPERS
jgi:hypothetical protein